MVERASALATVKPNSKPGLKIEEAPGFALTQISPVGLKLKPGIAMERDGQSLFLVSPKHVWSVGRKVPGLALSSSRTRILIEGGAARGLLAEGIAIDFHPDAFRPGHFASTGLHHTPVMVHCLGENAFHLYAQRTFALSVWEWLAG